ncbi:hypothetical protein N9H39_01300 [Gammaproteobacteria bacterium]|nr:hypothetical protein [Gammaproteobacteria bacterium]
MVYTVIRVAFGRALKKLKYSAHLGPVRGRVTTALRCVVTRPFARERNAADAEIRAVSASCSC